MLHSSIHTILGAKRFWIISESTALSKHVLEQYITFWRCEFILIWNNVQFAPISFQFLLTSHFVIWSLMTKLCECAQQGGKSDGFIFTGSWRISLNYLRFWTLIWFFPMLFLKASHIIHHKCENVCYWARVYLRTRSPHNNSKMGKKFFSPG